ncbi:MAG: glycosyltransferase family 4 protein [Anaerolineaceae bacterium]|nr:glycosyltransferase family 4 protein [Anaerolineaceae bacterium]MBN2677549.1 glycosyltransferase family 4 protein [Anaerolineaceae bacterium]
MHILITRSNPISPDPRVEKIGKALIAAGYTVSALGWDRTGKLPGKENRDGVIIQRLCIPAGFGKGLGNLQQLLRWQLGLWRWLLKHRAEYELIHACDFDTILPALWLKTFFHKNVVYDIFDFYADHLRATPGIIKKMIRQVDLWVIGRADALILVDDARIEQVAGSKPRLTAIIYNSPEDTFTEVAQRTPQKSGYLRLAYIGLLQIERGLLEMITVLARHPKWELDLAGFGGDEQLILKKIANLPNIHWHGRVDYQKAMELSSTADVLFATYDPAIPNHKFSSPNKIFEAMMLGKPVIVASGTNMDRMIAKADCGSIVPYGDIVALETVLTSLAASPKMVRRLGRNARMAYETTYAWSIMSQRLIQLYEKVIVK